MEKNQKEICEKYGLNYVPSPKNMKVGISINVREGVMPINGLRHELQGDTTGWYIWGGEYSEDPDFFLPLHVEHLRNWSPIVEKYLGLPPGSRFLITNDGYEDVWEDKSLLDTNDEK